VFNFAVAGALQRYQPIQREFSIKAVDPVTGAKEVHTTKDGSRGEQSEPGALSSQISKSQIVRGYGSTPSSVEPLQRKRAWTVGDLMTKPVKTLKSDDPIPLAWGLLERTGFRHIPIVNKARQVEGLVSDRDLLPLSEAQRSDHKGLVSTIMVKRVLTCFPEASLRIAARTMLEEGFSSLPVVDSHGVLQGIITTGDILKALANEAPVDLWA
jgi:CBS domain-containing protein